MDIPGTNPIQNRNAIPGQTQAPPDLILGGPKGRVPTQQPQQAPAQAPTQGPFQAPATPQVQTTVQTLTTALMEMNIPPTPQNLQMAQMLANYGHAVNTHTMGVLRQAMSALPDKSAASMEAAMILLTRGLPVSEQNVAAVKQFLNGQPLPQQLQNLPQNLSTGMQQMQQVVQQGPNAVLPGAQQAANPAAANPTAANPAAANPTAANPTAANPTAANPTAANPAAANPAAANPAAANPAAANPTAANPAAANPAVAQPGTAQALQAQQMAQQTGQAAAQTGQVGTQQVAQAIQSGQSMAQIAGTSASVQQFAGQAQAVENKSDNLSRIADKSTAQRVDMEGKAQGELKAIKGVDSQQPGSNQSQNVGQHLPQARTPDQQALHQLYLYLQGGEVPTVERVNPGSVQSPEEALMQMLKVLQDLSQISRHLAENMQLKDYAQLGLQHEQIMQLTGNLEAKLREFQQLFLRAFPEMAGELHKLLQEDGMDMFSKLAHIIDENQSELQQKLRLTGSVDEQSQILLTLRQLVEQVGLQVEKIQAHLVAREMLAQTLPCHCIPIMVHANGEAYPAEIYVNQDYDPDEPGAGPDGERPMKLTLTLETKNLGRVAVDLAALKDDMMVDMKVETRRIKLKVDEHLDQLQHKVERLGDYKLSNVNCRVVPDLESRQSMLLPPKRHVRSLRRVEGVV